MINKGLTKLVLVSVIIVIAVMVLSPFTALVNVAATPNSTPTAQVSSNFSPSSLTTQAPNPTPVNWTYPTNTTQEPGYTGGTYKVGATNNVGHLNIYLASSLYSFLLLDEIYDTPTALLPNSTISPWLATSWSQTNLSGQGKTTYDPLTGQTVPYNYTWTVNIRPGVQWTDWNSTNQGSTYVYSNYTSFNNTTGTHFTHQYSWSSVTMDTHYVQSADFILSWKMLQSSTDFSGSYSNIVNMVPTSNLSVTYYLSNLSATFLTYTLATPILPYHIWAQHDWSTLGAWNYTGAKNGYDQWDMNVTSNGYAPGLVGSGPFMMNGGYGMPKGYMQDNHGWQLYVNPYYFVQYANLSSGLRQFTPKVFSVEFPYYTSLSNAVTAELKGQIDTITRGVTPNFVPTVLTMPNTYIYHKPSSGYAYMQLNSNPSNAPFNITAFRQALNYATNKAYLASVVDSGYTVLGQPLIPPSDPLWRNASTPSYTYNPQKALSLISGIPGMTNQSGQWYYNGKAVKADIQITSAASNPLGVEGALLIAKWWGEIGVPTTVTQESFTTLIPNLIDYNYNTISLGITGISGDPTADYFAFYNEPLGNGTGFYLGPYSSLNYSGTQYTGKQIESLMNNLTVKLNSISNLSERIAISKELQGIAAEESTMITLGYPVDILEFTNTTFVNISTSNTQPYSGYMYWAFLTVHQRTSALTSTYTSHLEVNVTSSTNIMYNGQYGNITVTVKSNTTGNTVSGATVFMGVNPAGALLNITSDQGTTNSKGQYTWEFKVLNTQSLIYTNDYAGAVNISAVAYEQGSAASTVQAGLSSVDVNVLPHSIQISTSQLSDLKPGGGAQLFSIKITNRTGSPVSGFKYTIQSLSGAVVLGATSSSQTVTQGTTPYLSVNNTKMYDDNNVISVSGVTGSNGTIDIMVSANATFNFAAEGSTAHSYIFFGNIIAGSPVTGASGYMLPAEMTTANNPGGFGIQQPVEFPVELVNSTPSVSIKLTTSETTMNYNGSITVTAKVTNASSGKAVSGYVLDFLAQNVLGANRGYFVNSSGKDILYTNPNNGFGSQYIPGIQLTTDSNGVASATFYPFLFTYSNASSPSFQKQAYTSSTIVPADAFIISVMGVSNTTSPVTYTVVNSAASIHAVTITSPSSTPLYEYAIIGVVVAVVVIGAAVAMTRRRKS